LFLRRDFSLYFEVGILSVINSKKAVEKMLFNSWSTQDGEDTEIINSLVL
jgi:hypothetical protein